MFSLKEVCVVVEVPEIKRGGSRDYMVCKPTLVFSLSLEQAEQYFCLLDTCLGTFVWV